MRPAAPIPAPPADVPLVPVDVPPAPNDVPPVPVDVPRVPVLVEAPPVPKPPEMPFVVVEEPSGRTDASGTFLLKPQLQTNNNDASQCHRDRMQPPCLVALVL